MCNQGDIRLQGGANNRTGRVEICNNGEWGTVCDDVWGAVNARVACRQLGFLPDGKVVFNCFLGIANLPCETGNCMK